MRDFVDFDQGLAGGSGGAAADLDGVGAGFDEAPCRGVLAAGGEGEGADSGGGEGQFAEKFGGRAVVVGEDDAALAIHALETGGGDGAGHAEGGEFGADAADENGAGAVVAGGAAAGIGPALGGRVEAPPEPLAARSAKPSWSTPPIPTRPVRSAAGQRTAGMSVGPAVRGAPPNTCSVVPASIRRSPVAGSPRTRMTTGLP